MTSQVICFILGTVFPLAMVIDGRFKSSSLWKRNVPELLSCCVSKSPPVILRRAFVILDVLRLYRTVSVHDWLP
jgi:hypothetical protein